jgi:hypothetical protein
MLSAKANEAAVSGGGYRIVPLHNGDEGAAIRICLVVQQSPDAVAGPFVLLRDLADASVYLGCLVDAAGAVREWLEIWVQNVAHFESSFPAARAVASNRVLDENWSRRARAFQELEPESFLATGWETRHPEPIFFHANLSGPVPPIDQATGRRWQLVRDDAGLKAKGLPEYSHSTVRYLALEGDVDTLLVPATPNAPENESTQPLSEAIGDVIGFNPAGGLMMARSYAPLSFEEWSDLLAGKPWKGIEHGRKTFKPPGRYRTLQDANLLRHGGGHLFLGSHGRAGQMIESFHLKLHLLAAALRLVRSHVQQRQIPFLNLSAESFRVSISEADADLPFLWNSRIMLAVPGEAVALPLASTEMRYFIPPRFGETSIYQPAMAGVAVSGRGGVRIRKVLPAEDGRLSLEGTIITQEKLALGGSDLLWLRLTLPSGRVDLYAHLAANEGAGVAAGEARFRTVSQELGEPAVAALREAEGVAFSNVPFETLPLMSTPCDLYALAVLAVRALFVDEEVSLPVALDEILSLARQVSALPESERPIAERLQTIVSPAGKAGIVLGPHRLLREKIAPEEAFRSFPRELWCETLAFLIRLFPGLVPESFSRDYSDAPALALENVFDEPLAELEKLLISSRSLIVLDWNANREISAVIRKILERHS